MRSLLIGLGGTAAAVGVLALGLILDGLPGAALVVLSPAIVALAVGAAVARATPRSPKSMRGLKRTREGRTTHRRKHSAHRCTECGERRELRGHIWVCVTCDLAASELTFTFESPGEVS